MQTPTRITTGLALSALLVSMGMPASSALTTRSGNVATAMVAHQADLLQLGDRGPAVADWQAVLNHLFAHGAPDRAPIAEDGVFGPQTRQATIDAQDHLGVAEDGIVGPITRDGVAGLLDAAD